MAEEIDISGIDKPSLLAALYNNARPMGMGVLHARGQMSRKDAVGASTRGDDSILQKECWEFDYLFGRPLKIDLGGDEAEPWLYDRDWGEGAFKRIVDQVRSDQSKGVDGCG